jgi:hydrogenase nickel incorporation protein HypA/HybF
MSLMEGMLRIVEDHAPAQGFGRVRTVILEIGKLAGVEVEALRFAFEAVTEGSIVEGAALEIEEPQGLGWCVECEMESPVETRYDPCPLCGKVPMAITGGTEMRVKALDVE